MFNKLPLLSRTGSTKKFCQLLVEFKGIFSCKQCNHSCTTACDLKSHMIIHSGEKQLYKLQQMIQSSCTFENTLTHSFWGKASQGSWLNLRENSSIQERNLFSCKQCKLSRTTACDLKSHMITHSGGKQLYKLQQMIQSSCTFENTLTHSFWGKASQVCAMQLLINLRSCSKTTHSIMNKVIPLIQKGPTHCSTITRGQKGDLFDVKGTQNSNFSELFTKSEYVKMVKKSNIKNFRDGRHTTDWLTLLIC